MGPQLLLKETLPSQTKTALLSLKSSQLAPPSLRLPDNQEPTALLLRKPSQLAPPSLPQLLLKETLPSQTKTALLSLKSSQLAPPSLRLPDNQEPTAPPSTRSSQLAPPSLPQLLLNQTLPSQTKTALPENER